MSDLARSGFFALYVAWLAAFPMAGPLLGEADLMPWFLLPHVLGLLAVALWAGATSFRLLMPPAVTLTAFGTLVFTLSEGTASQFVLLLVGAASAPLSVRMGLLLKGAQRPVLAAALGLAGGSVIAAAFAAAPIGHDLKLVIAGCALLAFTAAPGTSGDLMKGPTQGLFSYLPFIFFFQVVSGLMYGKLYPDYAAHGTFAGVEIGFYMAGALGAFWLLRIRRDLSLLAGVFIAMLGLAAWQLLPVPLGVNLGTFSLLLAAGIIDLFLLAHVLSFTNQLKAYGYGVGVLCAGIVVGHWLAQMYPGVGDVIALFGLVLLNLAVMVLYLTQSLTTGVRQNGFGAGPLETATLIGLPDSLARRFLEQERLVLEQVLHDKTYREVADALSISESSVKTYMQRIYRKAGVVRRHQLMEILRHDDDRAGRN